ncbi:MAG: thioredoxin-like domain-containing protein, partial [Gammaproteobacteria bacterium]
MKGLVRISVAVVAVLAAGWFLAQFGSTRLSPGSGGAKSYVGQFEAAEFPQGLDWLNTGGEELSLAELRGKIVLLDFWTYGCINCIHVIPDLKKLEATYADELVVIGVHSAKFERESETNNIRRLVMRYELEHPVVNDKDFRIWKSYHAQGWPHLAMIDPEGKLIGTLSGEGHYEFLDNLIGKVIEEFDAKGVIDRTPVTWILESESLAPTDLLFPGRVLADAAAKRLFIADSNHNRIVITDLDGVVIDVIGSGEIGLVDGDYEETLFFRPQGLALAG